MAFLGISTWFVLFLSLHHVAGDEFTNPSNSNADFSTTYKLGETVHVTWNCSLDSISLLVTHWDEVRIVGVLLSQSTISYLLVGNAIACVEC